MTAIVFPGQGSQFIEMSKDFYDNFDTAREVFELIADTTKIDIKDIIFNNPADLLNQTQYTQLSIFCSSISIFKVLSEEIDIQKFAFLNFASFAYRIPRPPSDQIHRTCFQNSTQ